MHHQHDGLVPPINDYVYVTVDLSYPTCPVSSSLEGRVLGWFHLHMHWNIWIRWSRRWRISFFLPFSESESLIRVKTEMTLVWREWFSIDRGRPTTIVVNHDHYSRTTTRDQSLSLDFNGLIEGFHGNIVNNLMIIHTTNLDTMINIMDLDNLKYCHGWYTAGSDVASSSFGFGDVCHDWYYIYRWLFKLFWYWVCGLFFFGTADAQ